MAQSLSEEFKGSINTGSSSILERAATASPSAADRIRETSRQLETVDKPDPKAQPVAYGIGDHPSQPLLFA